MPDHDAILLHDIASKFYTKKKEPRLYGRRGEKVTKIADHGAVWIVKGKSGLFPVHISKIKIIKNAKDQTTD